MYRSCYRRMELAITELGQCWTKSNHLWNMIKKDYRRERSASRLTYYQVPPEIKHPLLAPPVYAWRKPRPVYGDPVGAGVDVEVELAPPRVVVVADGGRYFGTYLMPVALQLPLVPSGEVGTNSPVATLPRVLYCNRC